MADYPWYKHYDEGVPHTLEPYPQLRTIDLLDDVVNLNPDHPMLIFQRKRASAVNYYWKQSNGAVGLTRSLTFTSAGSQTVSYSWTVSSTGNLRGTRPHYRTQQDGVHSIECHGHLPVMTCGG
jgi:hypothetical protein